MLTTFSATTSAGQAVQVGSILLNLVEFPGNLCYCSVRACFCYPLMREERLHQETTSWVPLFQKYLVISPQVTHRALGQRKGTVVQHLMSAPGKSLGVEEGTHSQTAGEVMVSGLLFSMFGTRSGRWSSCFSAHLFCPLRPFIWECLQQAHNLWMSYSLSARKTSRSDLKASRTGHKEALSPVNHSHC